MIEQSQRSLLPTSAGDLDKLQARANKQRSRRHQGPQSLQARWQQARTTLASPASSVTKLPARFALHAIVALILPLAVVLSQLQPSALIPAKPAAVPQTNSDFVVPVAPLSLDGKAVIGDAPLADDGEIPVPLSLTSRSAAIAPVVVDASIAGERVTLRNGPSTDYDAVGRLSVNAPVQVIGRYNDWYQVRESVDKPVYWISGELLNLPESAIYTLFEVQQDAIPSLPPPKVGTVNDSGLQLRDGPGTNYVPMTALQSGATVDLLETYQDWYHVGIPGGTDGWVKAQFISADQSIQNRLIAAETIPDPNPALVGTISDNSVNLRLGPDSKYTKVAGLDAGTQITLVGKYNDWFKVQLSNGTPAWVFSDFLNMSAHVARRLPTTKDFPALPVARVATPAKATTTTSGTKSGTKSTASAAANIPASGDVASFAVQFVGSRYVWGGASPSGFDCSGLTAYVYGKYGVRLPHSASGQFSTRYGASVGSSGNLAPGDLVFFAGTAGERGISHVAMYIGGGRIVHAMTPRLGVQVSNINEAYWQNHYYGAIRVSR